MIAAIIQARMGSSRLPNKVLMNINGVPLLEYQINRLRNSKFIEKFIVATTTNKGDSVIYELCKSLNLSCFRGSENDVLNRYYNVALEYHVNTIIRITADCPFVDPFLIDTCLENFFKGNYDYYSNTTPPETSKFPDGSDIEIFTFKALEFVNFNATALSDREHVTFPFWKSSLKNLFKTSQLQNNENWSEFRYTVDYPEDFEVISRINEKIKIENIFGTTKEIVRVLKQNLDIKKLNSKYYFGIGWEKSFE